MQSTTSYTLPEDLLTDLDLHPKVIYAGFWMRFAACVIDSVIVFATWVFIFLSITVIANLPSKKTGEIDTVFYLSLFVSLLYFPFMECSLQQGTLGKKAVGIKVTTIYGERIGLARALVRTASRVLSSFFCIGYLVVVFNEKRQGWHDTIAKTLVVKK